MAPRHTKEVAYKTLVCPQLDLHFLFGIPIMKLKLHKSRRCRGQLQGGPVGDGEIQVYIYIYIYIYIYSVGDMLDEIEWRPVGSNPP